MIYLTQTFHSSNILAFPELYDLVQTFWGVPPVFHRFNFNNNGYGHVDENDLLGGTLWLPWRKFNADAENTVDAEYEEVKEDDK